MRRLLPLALGLFHLIATPGAAGDSFLGVKAADLAVEGAVFDSGVAAGSLGALSGRTGAHWPAAARLRVDVAISAAHGLEAQAGLRQTPDGVIGEAGGVLYLAPAEGVRYGLVAVLSDRAGDALRWHRLGVAGQWAGSARTVLGWEAGIGRATFSGVGFFTRVDYAYLGASLHHRLSPALELEASATVANFNESLFRASGADLALTLWATPPGSRLRGYVGVGHSLLWGPNGAPAETTLRAGLTVPLGGRAAAAMPRFAPHDPIAQLVRRGLF